MSTSSHIVQRLISMYRVVVRRQRVKDAQQASAAYLMSSARRMENLEALEQRVMLSTTTFDETPKATFLTTPRLTANMQGVLKTGINKIADAIDANSTPGNFSSDIPGVQMHISGQQPTAVNISSLLSSVGSIGSLIKSKAADSIGALPDGFLSSLNIGTSGGIVGLNPDLQYSVTINNEQLTPVSGDQYKLTVDVSLTVADVDVADNLFFDLGRNVDQLGVRQTTSNLFTSDFGSAIKVKAGLSVSFTAGTDVTITEGDFFEPDPMNPVHVPDTKVTVADDDSGFFMSNGSIFANANIDTVAQGIAPVASNEQFGFLDVDLKLKSFVLDGHLKLGLEDASHNSTVSFAGLDALTHTAQVVSGTISSEVDVTVDNVGSFSSGFDPSPTAYQIQFFGTPLGAAVSSIPGSGDHRTAPQVKLNTAAQTQLEPYKNVSAGTVAGMIKAYSDKLGTLPASSVLNTNLPLATGTTLGDLIPIGKLISNHLIFDSTATPSSAGTKLVDSNGNPSFTSLQSLVNKIHDITGLSIASINPTLVTAMGANQIVLTIGLDLGTAPSALAASMSDINLNLDSLEPYAGLKSSAKVSLTPTGHVGFTFGIDVNAVGGNQVMIPGPVTLPTIIAIASTPTSLTNDAVFKLTVGGSPNGSKSFSGGVATVTLKAADTAGDATPADLVAKLQTAINTALDKLDLDPNTHLHTLPNPVSMPIAGHLLVKVGMLSNGRLTLTSEFSSFMKVASTSGDLGGFGQLGLMENQTASSAPTPANGKLSGDVTFKLRVGTDPALKSVSLTQASTNGNTTIAQLLAQLDTAVSTATGGKVHAVMFGSSITLQAAASERLLQILDPSAAVLTDIGWLDRQIGAEISATGRDELSAAAQNPTPNLNGKPGVDVSFSVGIGAESFTVNVLQHQLHDPMNSNIILNSSNTDDNSTLSDLASDINAAFGTMKLADGRLLGSVITATAVDLDNTDGNGTPDTIVFRSTADIAAFTVTPITNGNAIGLTGAVSQKHIGPEATLPAGGATFTVTVGDSAPVEINVLEPGAASDRTAAIVKAIQAKIDATALAGHVVVGRAGNHIVLSDPVIGDRQIRITLSGGTAAGQAAEDILGFQDDQTARSQGNVDYFIQDAGAQLGVTVAVTNGTATGHVGFVAVDVGDIDASASLSLDLQLKDNSTGASRININKIDGSLTDITITGTTPLTGHLGAPGSFGIKINGGAAVTINVPDTASTVDGLIANIQAALDAAAGTLHANVVASVNKAGDLVLSVSALQAKHFEITAPSPASLGLAAGGGFSLLNTVAATWSGNLDIKQITVDTPIPGLDMLSIPNVHQTVGSTVPGVADFSGVPSLPPELQSFLKLAFDGVAGVTDALQKLADFFNGSTGFGSLPFIGTKIPIINKSLADLLNIGDSFQKVIDAFKANPTDSVQGLKNRLIEALNLPSNDPNGAVNVSFDSAHSSLLLDLTFAKGFNSTLPVDINLPGLPFDLKGNAALEVDGSATAKLGLGIDLSDPLHPKFFLNTDGSHTKFDVRFAARGSGMSFNLSFGPAGLFINDGSLAIDADGNPLTKGMPSDDLNFNVSLLDQDGTSDNRVLFTDLISNPGHLGATHSGFVGALKATLPIYFPTDSDFLGNLGITIPSIEQFLMGNTSGVTVDVPDLSNIVNNLNFNILDNLPLLIDGVDSVLAKLQNLLDTTLGKANLPLVGKGIHDAAQFIANIRSAVFENLRAKFTGAVEKTDHIITDALTDVFTNLGILKSAASVDDAHITDGTNAYVEWNFPLGQKISVGSAFDLGLPIFGLKSTDPIKVGLEWHVNLAFGLDFVHGFYFKVNNAMNSQPEVGADITLDLPHQIEGNLLFFKLTATDKTPDVSDATAGFGLDLSGGDSNGRVGIADLGTLNFDPKLTGNADIDLHLKAGINGGGVVSDKVISALPSIVADFKLQAGFQLPADAGGNAFTLSHVSMDNIGLDLGSFFKDFLSPLVQGIQKATEPLQPFIDVFTAPIPVISDLAGQPITLLDVAALFGDVDPGMLEAIAKLVTLVNSIPDPSKLAGGLIIPFGSVTLIGNSDSSKDMNLFDQHAFDAVKERNSSLTGVFGDAVDNFNMGGFADALTHSVNDAGTPTAPDPDVSSFATGLGNKSIADFIDFPVLNDPSQIIGALFGRPFTLVTLDLPAFSFGFSYSQFFPIIGPLGASITGSLGAKFDFAFGYDSFGLQKFAEGGFKHPLDIFRGFYISDTAKPDGTGADVNEVEITGSLVGSAELNLGVAKGSVGGGVKVTFGLNLNDPNHDGKVRIEELVNNLRYAEPPFNPLGIFDLNIKVEAFLTWAIEVLFVFKASGQIGPSLPLLDLTIPLPHSSVLATDVGDGVLRLNSGNFSTDRLNNDTSDSSEHFKVVQTAPGEFDVTGSGNGFSETNQHYSGFTSIEAYGGQGNDTFEFVNVTVPVLVDGGQGDDKIDASQSPDSKLTATGGTGNDTILGGGGNDTANGNDGNDIIIGGGGDDFLHGDGGDDTVSGDGNDTIFGDAGDDKLAGGPDQDFISGGAGNDEIWGDATFDAMGNFHAATSDGNDVLSGDDDKDTIHGDGGNDSIGGGAAADLIEGGLGADLIYGDSSYVYTAANGTNPTTIVLTAALPQTAGSDRIYGESATADLTPGVGTDGGDEIHGEAGNDFIRGNSGNDKIFGEDGNDFLFGDQNNDSIEGGDGSDIAFGGADNDTVLGQAGSDILFGDDGLVVYFNFPNFTGYQGDQIVGGNRLIGDGSSSIVPSAAGFDSDVLSRDLAITDVRNSDGDDYVDGAAGNDLAFGGKGNDKVFGDIDSTTLNPAGSAVGNDILFGDGGQVRYSNHLITLAATVTPDKGGNDSMYGNNGDDILFGGFGDDLMNGGHGTAFATTGSDQDILLGDNGEVDFTSGKRTKVFTTDEGVGGVDVINGNEDNDIAMGGAKGDSVNGNTGDDILIGDQGEVDFTSDSLHVTVIKTTDTAEAGGGIDNINGNTGKDIILGGVQGDVLNGNEDNDVILGDEGQLLYNLNSAGFDADVTTLDKIETTSFTLGGNDLISGNDGNDTALGGSGADTIGGNVGDDVLIGDQGELDYFKSNVTRIITTDTQDSDGGIDLINGNDGKDIILGGVAGDNLNGNNDADIILGDEGQLQYNLTGGTNQDGNALTLDNIETLQPTLGGSDVIQGNAGADIAFGGAKGDTVFGDADAPVAANDGNDILFGDGGRVSLTGNVIWKLESTDTAIGGSDYMEGNAGSDIMIGGAFGDEMHGDAGVLADINAALDGNDIMLGDNGLLNWLYLGTAAFAATIEAGLNFAVVGADIATLDLITTIAPNDGGKDLMFGNAGSDIIFGGTDADLIVGDNTKASSGAPEFGTPSARPGSDLEFGDHGRLYPQHSFLPNFPSRNFFSIDIGFTSGGAGDRMFGNETDDVMIGGQGDDEMWGNAGDDDMIGGHNVTTTTGADRAIDELKTPTPTSVNDLMDGGTGDDAMAGDNAIIWRNSSALQANDLRQRFRTLNGSLLYVNGMPNINPGGHNDPLSATTRSVFLLDHSLAIQTADLTSVTGSRWGNDIMAGNADDDALFGELGDDMIQGDGEIGESTTKVEIFEGVKNGVVTDGNDYIEGNGGSDMLIGNLGQDDIIGGSSQLFGLTTGDLRPDAGDIIFGGAATPDRVKRHAFTGDVAGDTIVFGSSLERRHAVDSDFIMGDNADIYRIVTDAGPGGVGGATAFVQFNYDQTSAYENRGGLRIVVRAYDMLDYSATESVTTSIGGVDVIHGESGDDFIHGQTGDDILFGDGENDEMFGERGRDWMSGGTGDDAMLGDNGFVLTSRNTVAEPLYGVTPTTQQYISEPGDFLQYLLNPNGQLKHAVDLEPFDQGGDDVMYGGLGDDVMHGGAGNDGISGAEALPEFYRTPETTPHIVVGDLPEDKSDEIRIVPIDGTGTTITGFYDYTNALPKMVKFFLNFENDLSLNRPVASGGIGSHFDPNHGDGKDFIFGDWGSDWLVGGSGRDHMYGGMGADVLNLDDDLETDAGANDQPDVGNLIPGDPGAPAQVYDNSDFGYGGGDRDLLIGNTGADRMEDWGGELNSFQVPFAPFGNGQVERKVPPSTFDFFYQMSESDGADQTRVNTLSVVINGIPTNVFGDPTRHGEPFAEMGLITQSDKTAPFDWNTNHGGPVDKQAGNTPGGKRDTRGDGLSGGTTNTTATSTPTMIVELTPAQVTQLEFAYWARILSNISNATLDAQSTTDEITDGDAIIKGLTLNTFETNNEYDWHVVLI